MADATYDAIVIGGGNKGLVVAMYLAKYGGMDVAIFESRHEAGGGWCTDEGAAPGFLADYHATGTFPFYTTPLEWDFPEWRELSGGYIPVKYGAGAVFQEDDSCIVTYHRQADPEYKLTMESIGRHSKRDAETWVKLMEFQRGFWEPYSEYLHNPPPPPGIPNPIERLVMDPTSGYDPSWMTKSVLEVARDLFESDALIAMLMRCNQSTYGTPPDMPGNGLELIMLVISGLTARRTGCVGGTHSMAHAATKIFAANGGKIFTKQEVDKVLIENGKAKGVRLTDGTEVEARKLVVSTLDPYNLCFRLIGKEHLNWQILRRVENLERRITCITWYTWALHELPNYKAASINPDINESSNLYLVSKDPEALAREYAMRRLNKIPEELNLYIMVHSVGDKTRAPEGKYSILTEQFVPPANAFTAGEWIEFKKRHAEQVINLWQKHAPNMTWDNVSGYIPLTPYDHCKLANMAPTGNWAVIDQIPSQTGRFKPIPELANYRSPIENLYATGSAWHPLAGGICQQGYICYKVIAQDHGLGKPWEKRPW